MAKLREVDIDYGNSIRDTHTLQALAERGVKIINTPESARIEIPKKNKKLRLALDYERAQELLWEKNKPKPTCKRHVIFCSKPLR